MEPLHNIPNVLYKYKTCDTNPEAKTRRILTETEVYLAWPDQFNDPFDASFPFRYKDEDLTEENIFLKLYELGRRQWPDMPEEKLHQICYERQSSGIFSDGRYWREEYPFWKKEINSKYGILSLTSKNDNLLMWSHYAHVHQGYCVGFDKHHLYKTIKGQLGMIIYSDDFPRLGLFDESLEGLTRILNTKSTHWKYEDEYRFVKIDSARTSYKLPDEAVKENIIGFDMPDYSKNEIINIANAKFPNAHIFETNINLEQFRLDMIPILRVKS